MKPYVRRSTKPAPKFYKPYTRVDTNGVVTVPEVKNVKYGNGLSMDKSLFPIEYLAKDLIKKYKIDKNNIATLGERVAKDYASLDGLNDKELYQKMCSYIEGPLTNSAQVNPDALMLFRNAWRNNQEKGNDHPDTLRDKEAFQDHMENWLPEDLWNITPLESAEEALKSHLFIAKDNPEDGTVLTKKFEVEYKPNAEPVVKKEVSVETLQKSYGKLTPQEMQNPKYQAWIQAMHRGKKITKALELWTKRVLKSVSVPVESSSKSRKK